MNTNGNLFFFGLKNTEIIDAFVFGEDSFKFRVDALVSAPRVSQKRPELLQSVELAILVIFEGVCLEVLVHF